MGANMRQLKHGLLILALGFPLSTFASPQFSDSSLPSPKGDCAGVTPSYGLVRQTVSIDAPGPQVEGYVYGDDFEDGQFLLQWADLFGADFPSRPGSSALFNIAIGKFVALQFTTSPSGDPIYGGVEYGTLEIAQPGVNTGPVAISISTCPGDFTDQVPISARCHFNGGQGVFPWILAVPDPFACTLNPSTTYYLNFAHVDPVGTNACSTPESLGGVSHCQVFVQDR
jgi:hypothetical protein